MINVYDLDLDEPETLRLILGVLCVIIRDT